MAQIDLEAISERLNLSLDHIIGTKLFSKTCYVIASSIDPERVLEVSFLLDNNGAKKAEDGLEDKELNLVITNSLRFEGWQSVNGREGVDLVTDAWVEKTLISGKQQSPAHFSPDPSMIFSGVIACATSIPVTDYELLQAGITALGGQWRSGLTKDVTHLFAISQDSQKYATAFNFKDQTGVKVLLPHWFDDAMRLGTGKLDTSVYEWPEPRLLKGGVGGQLDEEMARTLKAEAIRLEQDEKRMGLFATAAMFTPSNHNAQASQSGIITDKNIKFVGAAAAHTQVWNGKRILLSRTLQVWEGRFDAVKRSIERAGGIVVRFEGDDVEEEMAEGEERINGDGDGGGSQAALLGPLKLSKNEKQRRKREADAVDSCDVYVTRWRNGRAFINAYHQGKVIGTLAWLFHVQSSGVMSNPPDQLLHYPIPQRIIEGISNHVISVTNYTGDAREYLKKLITTMGARFTPSMSGQNTVLIAAYTSGTKATKALSWSIAVVNHTWLEDCFVQWRNLTVATEKYISFPPGVDFAPMLGTRGVDMEGINAEMADLERLVEEQEIEDLEEEQMELERLRLKEEEQEAMALGAGGDVEMEGSDEEENPPGNTASSIKEVQGLVDSNVLSPDDVDMDLDMSRGPGVGMDLDWEFREDDLARVSPAPRNAAVAAKEKEKAKAKETTRPIRDAMDVEGPSVMEEMELADEDDENVIPASTKSPAKTPARPTKPIAKVAESAKTPAKTPVKTPIKARMKGKSPKKKATEPASPLPDLTASEEEDEIPVPKKPVAKAKPVPQPSPSPSPPPPPVPDLDLSDDDEVEDIDFRAMAMSQAPKAKGKESAKPVSKKKQSVEHSEEEEEVGEFSEPEVRRSKAKETRKAVTGKGKGKAKAVTPPPTSPSDHSAEEEEEEEEEEAIPLPKKRSVDKAGASKAGAGSSLTKAKQKAKELAEEREREAAAKKSKGKQKEVVREETRSPTPEPVPNRKKLTRRMTVEIIMSPSKKVAETAREKPKEKTTQAKKGRKSVREESDEEEYGDGKAANASGGENSEEEETTKKKTPAKTAKPPAKSIAGKEKGKTAKGRNAKSTDDDADIVSAPKPKGVAPKTPKAAQPETVTPATPATTLLKRTKADARTKVKKRKSVQKEVESEEEEEEEVPVAKPKVPKRDKQEKEKPKTVGKKTKGKAAETEDEVEDEEVADLVRPEAAVTSKKGKTKGGKKAAVDEEHEEEEEEEEPAKNRKKPLRVYSTDDEQQSSEDESVPAKVTTTKAKGKTSTSANAKSTLKGKTIAKEPVDSDKTESDTEDEVVPPKKGRPSKSSAPVPAPKSKATKATKEAPKSKSKPVRTPEDTEEEEEEEAEVTAAVSPRATRAVARTQGPKAAASAARDKSPTANISARSRRASTSKQATYKASSSRAPPPQDDDDDDAMDVDEPVAGPSRSRAPVQAIASERTSPTPPSTMSLAPAKRSAATKASQKLRDTIMPDVMNFENQRRKSRKSGTAAFVVIGDSLPREETSGEGSGKRRRESAKDKEGNKEGEGEEDEEGAEKPKKKRRVSDEHGAANDGKGKVKEDVRSAKPKTQRGGKQIIEPGDLVVMTTQAELTEEAIKGLDKLGVKFTTTPEECTHLIAGSFVRTEKFICALASRAPYILTKEWAINSATAGKLLPVEEYALVDPEGEEKYKVKLSDVLKRAKANRGGKLLNGAQIFVTPKVSVKRELLSHVVQACGGVCKHPGDFTQRMFKGHENRYLISCPEDKAIWLRFSNQDIPVYSHEVILNGALQQRMEWDNPKYRLDQ